MRTFKIHCGCENPMRSLLLTVGSLGKSLVSCLVPSVVREAIDLLPQCSDEMLSGDSEAAAVHSPPPPPPPLCVCLRS